MFFRIFILVAPVLSILACTSDEPVISEGMKIAEVIAGKKGTSKTWILKSLKLRGNEVFDGVCKYDNEYTFYHNPSRSFDGTEGNEICVDWNDRDNDGIKEDWELVSYGDLIESGNWNISDDGKFVLISSINTQSRFAIFSLASPYGFNFPSEIWKLTETELHLKMNAYVGIEFYDIVIVFEKK